MNQSNAPGSNTSASSSVVANGVDDSASNRGLYSRSSYLNINETFVTDGGEILLKKRLLVARSSLGAANERLQFEKSLKNLSLSQLKSAGEGLLQKFKKYAHKATQVGGDRPLSSCSISKSSSSVVTGCWSGQVNVWDLPSLSPSKKLMGHNDRVSCVSFNPLLESMVASGDASGIVNLWSLSLDGTAVGPTVTLKGHPLRVARLAFHPIHPLLCTASFDTTWRLWDLETGKCLLLQEGHSKEVFSIDVHPDGALVASGGLDGNGVVWDIRSGRPIFTMKGHASSIYGISFSPSGRDILTGSEDCLAKHWDLRKLECVFTICAHPEPITSVKYVQESIKSSVEEDVGGGHFAMTTSQDGSAKIWNTSDWSLVSALNGHFGKVMHGDLSIDGSLAVTAGYDRTLKLWSL